MAEAAFDLIQTLSRAHIRADTVASHSEGANHGAGANDGDGASLIGDGGEVVACAPSPNAREFLAAIRACAGDYPRALRLLTDVKRSAAQVAEAAAAAAAPRSVSGEAGAAEAVAGAVAKPVAIKEADAESVNTPDARLLDEAVAKSVDKSDAESLGNTDAEVVEQAEPEADLESESAPVEVVAVHESGTRLLIPEHYQAAIEACGRGGNTRGVLALLDELRLGDVGGSGSLETAAQLGAAAEFAAVEAAGGAGVGVEAGVGAGATARLRPSPELVSVIGATREKGVEAEAETEMKEGEGAAASVEDARDEAEAAEATRAAMAAGIVPSLSPVREAGKWRVGECAENGSSGGG